MMTPNVGKQPGEGAVKKWTMKGTPEYQEKAQNEKLRRDGGKNNVINTNCNQPTN